MSLKTIAKNKIGNAVGKDPQNAEGNPREVSIII